jgi:hypothetical protein
MLKDITSKKTDEQESIEITTKLSKKDLFSKLKEGILNQVERKMHTHAIEQENMDREIKNVARETDQQVEAAKAQAKEDINNALTKKEELQQQLANATSQEEKDRLMKQLGDVEGIIAKKL